MFGDFMDCLSKFFCSAAGAQLRRWEAQQLDQLLKGTRGGTALQLGAPFGPVMRSASHSFKVFSAQQSELTTLEADGSTLCQSYTDFPFRENTFDLVILVHVLERSPDYEKTLSEVLRVLAPEGRMVILGLNPWGPWWIRKRKRLCKDLHHPVSVEQIKKSLGVRALIDRGRFGIYSPSLSDNPHRLMSWSWCEKAGDRWWPALANGFMLSAVKKVSGVHLVGSASKNEILKKTWVGTAAARNVSACKNHR